MKPLCLVTLSLTIFSFTTASADSEEDAIRITMNEFHKRTHIHSNNPVSVAADDKKNIEASTSSRVFSKYIDDAGLVAHNGPVVQSELTIVHVPSGFYVDIWHSASISHGGVSSNYGNEIDYTLGWSGDFAGIEIDAGITYIDNITLFTMPVGDSVRPYVELNKKFEVDERNTMTPFIKTEYGIPAKGGSRELKGLHIHSGLKHHLEITKGLNVNQKVVLTLDDGAFGADRALVGAYEITPSYRFLKQSFYTMSFELSARAIGPLAESKDHARKFQLIGGAGLLVDF
jgi:hypothetical protein